MADGAGGEPAYQTLYRRFRPQRFEDVLGQDHVSLALRNAVRSGHVGHAYLFSGPRGTGKTSTARILAKALNCANPVDGEPCGVCDSCVEITRGSSLDVHELDAASNNGVDSMRDLVSHAALGTPGRWKVYIVDEVHMLSTAASNALLKTLEEPPGHVVFVLATTDVQKVLATIRSRTQQYEFHLLGPEVLAGLLRGVRDSAGLELSDEAVESAVRRGRGSARDALSALDQVAAAGGAREDELELAELGEALAGRDTARALAFVARAVVAGLDPQRLSSELSDYLRQGFLATVAPDLVQLAGSQRTEVADVGVRIGLPGLVRAMEALGRAQVDMRDAPDPRVHLEVALIRLTHPEADDSAGALLERIERLERGVAAGGAPAAPSPPPKEVTTASPRAVPEAGTEAPAAEGAAAAAARPTASDVAATPESGAPSGPDMARRSLGAVRRQAKAGAANVKPEAEAPVPLLTTSVEAGAAGGAAMPSRDELVQVWGDGLLASLPGRARARFRVGRFVAVDDGTAVFALPNETHRSYCEDVRIDVERALGTHFGRPVPLRLVVDEDAARGAGSEGGDDVDAVGESAQRGVPAATATATADKATATRSRTTGTDKNSKPRTEDPPQSAASAAPVQSPPAVVAEPEPDLLDPVVLAAETELAGAGPTPEQRLKLAFPGAEEV